MTTTVDYRIGDVFAELAAIPDASVDLIVTSPPFLALRSYLPADHPDKAKEIGSEPTPAAFLDTMLALTAEWRRVLTPTGSIAVEIGDTYSGSGGAGRDYWNADNYEPGKGYTGKQQAHLRAAGTAVGTTYTTLGWSDCGHALIDALNRTHHDNYRPGVVLDPFAGSGTTLLAAALTGRDAIGIDLDARNHQLAHDRIADACHITGTSPWHVTADLPGIKGEHPDQQSLFDGDDAA